MLFTANNLIYTKQFLGEIVEDLTMPYSLANALQETRKKGLEAASMPKLIQMRIACDDFTDPLWCDGYHGLSGVYRVGDSFFFSHGNKHPLARPERIRRAIDRGLIDGAACLTPAESRRFTQEPFIDYDDFLRQSARNPLPEPYTIRAEAALFHRLKDECASLKTWKRDPRTIIYTGGKNAVEPYAERLREQGKKRAYLSFDTAKDLPDRGRMLFLDYGGGLIGDDILDDIGRFVGVAPKAQPIAKKNG